ncbi:hypothetical protein [Marimonas lutisalis]|uniref:hypothetical protein n=1 Tax=Marimonas lutisalis TaxID=2545756 RepID=UPI0010F9EF4F|nr:hypothetical protein [Marimonas lutisalis]
MADGRVDDREYALELYRAYREKVVHEDALVNQRIFWFVTFQALLFTSFSLLTEGNIGPLAFRLCVLVFSLVGVGSAASTYFSVSAAFRASAVTAESWRDLTHADGTHKYDPEGEFPAVAGARMRPGAEGNIELLGKYTGYSLPILVIVAWILLSLIVFEVPDVLTRVSGA